MEAGAGEGEETSWLVEDAPDGAAPAVVGATTEGPVTSLARVSFEDACAETAASFRDSRGETVGATLGAAAGRTGSAKANSPVEASGGASGAGDGEGTPGSAEDAPEEAGDAPAPVPMTVSAAGPASSHSLVSFEDACAGTARAFRVGWVETVGAAFAAEEDELAHDWRAAEPGKLEPAPPRRTSAPSVGHALACPSVGHALACPSVGHALACPSVGHALACPSAPGLNSDSKTSGVRRLDPPRGRPGTSACATSVDGVCDIRADASAGEVDVSLTESTSASLGTARWPASGGAVTGAWAGSTTSASLGCACRSISVNDGCAVWAGSRVPVIPENGWRRNGSAAEGVLSPVDCGLAIFVARPDPVESCAPGGREGAAPLNPATSSAWANPVAAVSPSIAAAAAAGMAGD